MENNDGVSRPRLRVVDTSGLKFSGQNRGKRRKWSQSQRQEHQRERGFAAQLQQQWPLEAMPIQRAVLEYGRRAAALGAQQGAQSLRTLAMKIRELGPSNPALEKIAIDAETEASRLRTMLDQVYEDD